MKKLFLVNTSIKKTWPSIDEKVLFLGDWCKPYTSKNLWEKFDYQACDYHWNDRKKLLQDYHDLNKLYEDILSELTINLNQIHNVNFNKRYWRIFIGPWIGNFIQILFDRWFMINLAFEKYPITEGNFLKRSNEFTIPLDMTEFIELWSTDDWNEAIYTKLVKKIFKDKLKINLVEPKISSKIQQKDKSFKLIVKEIMLYFVDKYNSIPWPDNSTFFISPYINRKKLFLLQLSLKQWPKFFFKVRPTKKEISFKKRDELKYLLKAKVHDREFENIVRDMISHEMPMVYLEGYNSLLQITKKMNWPDNPKNIFTSTSFYDDDVFKFWAAEKTNNISKLFIYQHGGNFGMMPFSFHEEHQIKIANNFLSWGWKNNNPKVTPFHNINKFKEVELKKDRSKALLILTGVQRYSYHLWCFPISSQFVIHDNNIQSFYKNLRHDIKKEVILRPYKYDYNWGNLLAWKEKFPELKVSTTKDLNDLYVGTKINIHTYNATTILESLGQNVPTLAFWSPIYWELNEYAKEDFNLLKKVGIYHESSESASIFLESIWDDVDNWWCSKEVQEVRIKFINKYNQESINSIKDLLKTLN